MLESEASHSLMLIGGRMAWQLTGVRSLLWLCSYNLGLATMPTTLELLCRRGLADAIGWRWPSDRWVWESLYYFKVFDFFFLLPFNFEMFQISMKFECLLSTCSSHR